MASFCFAHNLIRVITVVHNLDFDDLVEKVRGSTAVIYSVCPGFTAAILSNRLCAPVHVYKCGTVVQTLDYASPAPTPRYWFLFLAWTEKVLLPPAVGLSVS